MLVQRGNELSVREEEDIAEKIDEQVHSLQYKLDHVRRYYCSTSYCFSPLTYCNSVLCHEFSFTLRSFTQTVARF